MYILSKVSYNYEKQSGNKQFAKVYLIICFLNQNWKCYVNLINIYFILGLQIPNNAFNAIEECSDIIFPCIGKIIFILCTLLLNVATAERSPGSRSSDDVRPTARGCNTVVCR